MANPHHFGADDPHRPRQLGSHPHTPISPIPPDFFPSHATSALPPHGQHPYSFDSGSEHVATGGGASTGSSSQQIHGYSPHVMAPSEPRRPHLSVSVPHEQSFAFNYVQSATTPQQPQHDQLPHSFYGSGFVEGTPTTSHLSHSQEGFRSFQHTPIEGNNVYLNLPPQDWPTQVPTSQQTPSSSRAPGGRTSSASGSSPHSKVSSLGKRSSAAGNSAKVPRHQFTACGACRHRRVKCDLRARQEEAEQEAQAEESRGGGGGGGTARRRKVSCTNCQERGTNCVDEYAPLKAAKQLRRGKRISEIEMLYGRSATDAALASQGEDADRPHSPTGRKFERIPELTHEFFESPFFRRFQIQRPIVDSLEFVTRYLSKPIPCAAAMGYEGAVLCHCLYAWAVSYGVDENGQLDVPDGTPVGPLNLLSSSDQEAQRNADRQRRMEKTYRVVRTILREIDEYGILRKPSWDGVRVLLLVLPLTEGLASSVERQALYQGALSQVFMLCSMQGLGYDGLPATLPESSMKDDREQREIVRMRIYWYGFVHESILSGLHGNTLTLRDDEDVALIKEAVEKQPLVNTPGHFHTTVKMATTPINFANACRAIHSALTGHEARRRDTVNVDLVHRAWDMLDKVWDEFESINSESPAEPYRYREEAIHFADSWKISVFEAHMTIRKALEDRLERLEMSAAGITTPSRSRSASPVTAIDIPTEIASLNQLLTIAKSKTGARIRQVVDIVRTHVGTRFFEWDASPVRDGIYLAAVHLARERGSDEDVTLCLQALQEGRWAFTKSQEKSVELRQTWLNARQRGAMSPEQKPQVVSSTASLSLSESPFTSPSFDTTSEVQPALSHGTTSWQSTTSMPSSARFSPPHPDALPHFAVYQPNLPHHSNIGQGEPLSGRPGPSSGLPPPHCSPIANPPSGVVYPQGQFVIQPDGSQVFVPYASMP